MARNRDLKVTISGDARGMDRALRSVSTMAGHTESRLTRLGLAGAKSLGALGVVAGGAALVGIKKSIDAASDLGEQMSKAGVVFRGSEKDILQWSKTSATAFGMSRREALEAAGVFGNMLVPMGVARDRAGQMSERMTELAGDLASFNNADPSEVLEALRSGLSGETEPLRRFGVFLTAARVEEEALSETHKKNKDDLTAAEKAQASYNLILKDSKDAQGDYQRTASSLPNLQRTINAQIEDTGATIGKSFLPAARRVATVISHDVLPKLEDLGSELGKIASRKDIDLGEKLKLSRRVVSRELGPVVRDLERQFEHAKVGEKLGQAFEKAAPVIADAAARSAPRAAGAFVNAFRDAGPWGKLITVAFLASKLGAFRAGGNIAADMLTARFKSRMGRSEAFGSAGRVGGKAFSRGMIAGLVVGLTGLGQELHDKINTEIDKLGDSLAGRILRAVYLSSPGGIGHSILDKLGVDLNNIPGLGDGGGGGDGGGTPLPPASRRPSRPSRPASGPGQNAPGGGRPRARGAVAHASSVTTRVSGRAAVVAHAAGGGNSGIVALGHQLQREGYTVGEHPAFGGVAPVHVQGSYHYRAMAIDVNGGPGGEPGSLDALYARLKGAPGVVELLWRVAGHFDHLHVAVSGATNPLSGRREVVSGEGVRGGAAATRRRERPGADDYERSAMRRIGPIIGQFGHQILPLARTTSRLGGRVDTLTQQEDFAGRRFGITDEDLDTVPGRINRVFELTSIQSLQKRRLTAQRQRLTSIRRQINHYRGLISSLSRELKRGSKHHRPTIRAQIKRYQDRIRDLKEQARELGVDIETSRVDIAETGGEIAGVQAGPDQEPLTGTAAIPGADAYLGRLDREAAEAELTPDTADDLDVARRRAAAARGIYDYMKSHGFSDSDVAAAARDVKSADDAVTGIQGATQDNTDAIKALTDEMKRLADNATNTNAVSMAQLARSLADFISGQITGVGYDPRAMTAGAGALARY